MSDRSVIFNDDAKDRATIIIELVPAETNDLETIACVEAVSTALRKDPVVIEHFYCIDVNQSKKTDTKKTRGIIEVLQFFSHVTSTMETHSTLIETIIGSGVGTIGLLLKQRRVKSIEVVVGKKKMRIEGADKSIVERSLQRFAEICREESGPSPALPEVKIRAEISKKAQKPQT